jgi:hypothetical protein
MNLNNFKVDIENKEYFIEFENTDTPFKKPLNLSITRNISYAKFGGEIKEDTQLLERKQYYRIRRRLYNNTVCINKLKDGRIKKYQVFNELELKVLEKYLTDKNILFRIIVDCGSYKLKYNVSDNGYKFYFSNTRCYYPEENKVYKSYLMYVKVYKEYVNLLEVKDRCQSKYGIYLYSFIHH